MTTYTFSVPVLTISNTQITAARAGELQVVVPDHVTSFSYRALNTSGFLDIIRLETDDVYTVYADGENVMGAFDTGSEEFGQLVWANGSRQTYVYSASLQSGTAFNTYFLEVGGDPLPNMTTLSGARSFFSRLTWADGAARGSGFGPGDNIDLASIPGARVSEDDTIHFSMQFGQAEIYGGVGDDVLLPEDINSMFVDGGEGTDILRFEGYSANAFNIHWSGAELRFEDAAMPFDEGGDQMQVRNVEQFEFARVGGGIDTFTRGELRAIADRADAVDLLGTEVSELLRGNNNHDRLVGRAGNDTLLGGDGADTLNGGDGNDSIVGGDDIFDERDIIYAGAGNDFADSGYGNDLLYGGDGRDTLSGGFGADEILGQQGQDTLNGGAFSDQLFGGDGNDYLNGGFGFDRVNGGAGADRFFHLGVADHGSDWIQDYNADEGDVLHFGNAAASAADFQVNFTQTESAGASDVTEAFVIHRPTGQILWALIDGGGEDAINLQIGAQVYDLLA
ncbi:calcium-binding protein [Shimia thalassica]|uniref:calcium-binding protein n=1 Tax=Shimia thalassica TaxID=1715693 RepID=UPI002736B3C1|nr:calcium-binding protein [Shimia thalassica]MDP2493268.1 calcium-binding protein [Shimia thalassica]